ncbi:MAG TPA: efflux RND transporter periplasmic adaptor subunit [Caulobacteraceae bacterium]|nr:efflux RND transporter periplasmic adaptor subunit [Caulobacteraceae bacterium]
MQILVVIVLAIAAAGLLAMCAKSGQKAGGAGGGRGGAASARGGRGGGARGGRPATTVGVAKASLGEMPIEQTALGTVTPMATVQVNARVSGQLVKVGFREGQMVRKGQLLMQLDPRPFQIALQQAQATMAHDEAALAEARVDLARYATLKAQDSIATQTFDTQVALVRQDEAVVKQDAATVANARLNLDYSHITAPVSGRVGLRQIDVGNQVTANQTTPVTVVTQIDPITIIFPLPEDAIGAVMSHHGGAGLEVTALDRSGGTVLAHGKLLTLDNAVNTTTGTVNGRAVFHNQDGKLFPFQFVNVILLVDTLENQVIVPTTAVRHGPKGDYVWVLQADRTVKQRPVTVGPASPETVSIASGLQAGETVITDGGDRLRDGGTVVLPGQRPAGGGGRGGHHSHGSGGAAGASTDDSAATSAGPGAEPSSGAPAAGTGGSQAPGAAAHASSMGQACRADIMRLCASEAASGDRDARRACMRQNFPKLSPSCQAAIKARMGQGGGQDGQ